VAFEFCISSYVNRFAKGNDDSARKSHNPREHRPQSIVAFRFCISSYVSRFAKGNDDSARKSHNPREHRPQSIVAFRFCISSYVSRFAKGHDDSTSKSHNEVRPSVNIPLVNLTMTSISRQTTGFVLQLVFVTVHSLHRNGFCSCKRGTVQCVVSTTISKRQPYSNRNAVHLNIPILLKLMLITPRATVSVKRSISGLK